MGVPAASGYPQYSGSLINPMFSMDLLERFYTSTVYSDISTTEYSGELEKGGDQITFWREPEVMIRDAYKNKKIEHDTINAEPVTMIIDRAKEFSIKVSQIDEKQIQNWPKWKESFLKSAGYQLAQAIDPDLMDEMYTSVAATNQGATAGAQSASINLGTAGAPLVITSDNIIEVLSYIHQVLDEAKAPRDGRFVILPPAGITALRNSDLQAAYMTGLSWSPLTNGRIPEEVMGFTIMQSLNIPSEVDATVNKLAYHIIAGVKMATAFAAQLEKTRVIEDKDDWATYYQGLTVYGFKVLYPEALVHVYATFDAS
jgi:P22 coat protein - gene protein 5.